MRKTKIVATIGPKSENEKTLKQLIKAGVNVCRQNFSHQTHKEHERMFLNIKKASKELNACVATLQDLSGPKIRTGENKDSEYFEIKKGKEYILTNKGGRNFKNTIYINYKKLTNEVLPEHRVLVHDGKITFKVLKKKDENSLLARAMHSGKVRSRRGVNFPDSDISISSLTEKDKRDLKLGIKLGFDFVALSFVRSGKDIKDLRKILSKENSPAKIIAKIETPQAIENFDEILSEADGIMVARGDLAVEIGAEKVPFAQKKMIKKANEAGKPVIVATQMLESMIHEPVPTRAEVSDIANAILAGADAVMLSEETAMGEFAKEAVEVMDKVARDTEKSINYEKRVKREYAYGNKKIHKTDAVTRYAAKTALDLNAKAIIAFTETGTTARMISRFRPKQPIFVISPKDYVLRQMQVVFGAFPGKLQDLSKKRDVIKIARDLALKKKMAKKGDIIVIVSGTIFGKPGETNTITAVQV